MIFCTYKSFLLFLKDTRQIRVKTSELKDILKKLINEERRFEKAGKLVN